jgi:CHAT domain-containing protein
MYISVLSYAPTLETLLKPRVFAPSLHVIDGVLVVSQPDASGLPRIPGAEREVELIRKIFSDSTDILYRSQSIVAAVSRAMKCHSWVHLAYHEIQHPRGPTKSAFLLHDDGAYAVYAHIEIASSCRACHTRQQQETKLPQRKRCTSLPAC